MKIKIFPYKLESESARQIARALNTLCVKPDGNYRPYSNHLIINWGNSTLPETWNMDSNEVLNHPNYVATAIDKLRTLRTLKICRIPTPSFTETFREAVGWLAQGDSIVARTVTNGSGGEGIVFINDLESTPVRAPLYTRFIPKAREYRLHVFKDNVIDMQQKKRREGNDSDGRIKNLENGWVFTRENMTPPPDETYDIAIRSIQALGLDFGAVDIVTKDGRSYVLEVNCAPGLEGTTLNSYVTAIEQYARNL